MKSLVTGGAGLIGSHIVDLLLSRGHQVVILDNLDPDTHPHGRPAWIPTEAEFIEGDVRSADDLLRALRGVRWVFHQAAFGGFTTRISRYIDCNATGTARLYEVIAEHGLPVEKVVVASSQAVYGEGAYRCGEHGAQFPQARDVERLRRRAWQPPCPLCGGELAVEPTPVGAPHHGQTPYALSKMVEERLAISMGRRYGIPTTALRYAIAYGPRQSLFNPYTGVVSIFSTRLLNDLPPVLYEDGRQIRDFIFVEDVAEGNLWAAGNPATDYLALNLGTGRAVTMERLSLLLAELYDRRLRPDLRGEFRPGDSRHIVHDVTGTSRLGFQPRTAIEQGLARYVEWISAQGPVEEYFTAAEERLRKAGVVQGGGA